MPWVAIVFGWPAVVASVILTGAGLLTRRWGLVLAGAVLAVPFLAYLTATPRFAYAAPLAALLYAAAVVAARRGKIPLAAALVLPFVALSGFLAFLVFTD